MNSATRTQSFKVPGLPCPSCQTPIVVDPLLLLSAMPIACAACGLELKVNVEKSADTLNALGGYLNAFEGVERDFAARTQDFVNEPTAGKPSGSRAPRRRQPRLRKTR